MTNYVSLASSCPQICGNPDRDTETETFFLQKSGHKARKKFCSLSIMWFKYPEFAFLGCLGDESFFLKRGTVSPLQPPAWKILEKLKLLLEALQEKMFCLLYLFSDGRYEQSRVKRKKTN